jgi:hypothetical protein
MLLRTIAALMTPPIDVDDLTTWPPPVYQIVSEWAARCAGVTKYTADLPLPLELDKPFRELFRGYLLRAYHYTRLLPHERQMVLSMGLRPLSAELLFDRIEAARSQGVISGVEATKFHEAHVFASSEQEYREGQVCLVLSRRVFERDPEGCRPLLTTWGGEGLYMSSAAASLRERLKDLGVPTAVVALLSLGERVPDHSIYPSLHKVFVGSFLRLEDVGADVFYWAPVPPERIESLEEVRLF